MPKLHHVKKARKDHPGGIKKGDSYYWWKFRFGPRRVSLTRPRRSQLTQSAFYAELWDLEDEIAVMEEVDQGAIDEIIERVDGIRDQCEDSLCAMPDHLQDTSSSGEMLTERICALEEWADNLREIDLDGGNQEEILSVLMDSEPGMP